MIAKASISSIIQRLFYFFLFIFLFTLPFSIKISNILLVTLAVCAILQPGFLSNLKDEFRNPLFALFLLFYCLHLIGLTYSENLKTGKFILEKYLSVILFPLILLPNKHLLSKNKIFSGLAFFMYGVALSIIYLLAFWALSDFESVDYFFREESYKLVQLHPSYLAMYIIFAILILLTRFPLVRLAEKIISSCIFLLFVIFIPFTGARTSLIALILVTGAFLIMVLPSRKLKLYFTAGIVLLTPLLAYITLQVPVISKRIDEIKETKLAPPLGIHFNSINLRVAQLNCSQELLESNFLWGVGTGDVQDNLNNCYQSHGWSPALYERDYNAHNQYLQTFLALGLPGLILFLFLLIHPAFSGFKTGNYLLCCFILLFAISVLTESMLEKNKGVVFWSCFTCILYLLNQKKNQSYSFDVKPDQKEKAGV